MIRVRSRLSRKPFNATEGLRILRLARYKGVNESTFERYAHDGYRAIAAKQGGYAKIKPLSKAEAEAMTAEYTERTKAFIAERVAERTPAPRKARKAPKARATSALLATLTAAELKQLKALLA